jgi:hypothetical protein
LVNSVNFGLLILLRQLILFLSKGNFILLQQFYKTLIWLNHIPLSFGISIGLFIPPAIFLHQVGNNNSRRPRDSCMAMDQYIPASGHLLVNPLGTLLKMLLDRIIDGIPYGHSLGGHNCLIVTLIGVKH